MTRFNTVKRKANVGERILITDAKVTLGQYKNGGILTVNKSINESAMSNEYVEVNEHDVPILTREYEVIIENKTEANGMKVQKRGSLLVKAVPTPDYQETIGFTENEDGTYSLNFAKMPGLVFVSYDGVGTFDQLFIHGDFKAEAQRIKIDSAVGEITKYTIESTPVIKTEVATLQAGETIIPKPKTPQQQRDDIIEQAKRDVTELTKKVNRFPYELAVTEKYGTLQIKFGVNREKRTVVALAYLANIGGQSPRCKGIAKCAPTDCFNAHLGKIIALRRALGLEVPAEYLNVPQPTEVRVGDKVRLLNVRINMTVDTEGLAEKLTGQVANGDTKIIDDTRDEVTR